MAEAGLPKDDAVDQMKLGKLTRLLQEFGVTVEETDEMDKNDARAELKRRLRAARARAANRRRPGQMTDMLQRAMSENKEKRRRLSEICQSIIDLVVSMDADDQEKMSKSFCQGVNKKNLDEVLTDVRTFLQYDDCLILVVGETSSGKSSILNLLLGEDVLPVSHLASTSTICTVRYGEEKKATVYLQGVSPDASASEHTIDLEDEGRAKEELASYVHRYGRWDADKVQKVVIQWPLQFLQGGICFVDSPGIMHTSKMDEVVASVLSSTCAFIYVINSATPLKPTTSTEGGDRRVDEHEDGLSRLLELCRKHQWGDIFDMSHFDLQSTMFICNKWDSVKQNERELVKGDYLLKLKEHFKELKDDQVFFFSCDKAMGPSGQLSPEFIRLLDGLDVLLPQSLQRKLELQYYHVHLMLQKACQYIRLKLHNAYGTKRQRQSVTQEARQRRDNFSKHAYEVLWNLDRMLTETRREAERLLKAFLMDNTVKSSVYQRILEDFPEVENSDIGNARLITAIADEVESQLKNNPRASEFNQYIRDADLRLKEEFQEQFGGLMEQHNKVMEDTLAAPHLPSTLKQLNKHLKEMLFTIGGAFSTAYVLARLVDPSLGSAIWTMVDLAKKLKKILETPDNREPYIKSVVDEVFNTMRDAKAIKSAVKKHLKAPIQYIRACKAAIPDLERVDQELIDDVDADERSTMEIRNIYEPRNETARSIAEELYGFFVRHIKKHEFDDTNLSMPMGSEEHVGGQGRVYRVTVSKDGQTLTAALKTPRHLPADETAANFVREADNLRKLTGPHIVTYFGTYCGGTDSTGQPILGLVMEYCPNTLDEFIFASRDNSPAWWDADPVKQAAAFHCTQDMAVRLCDGLMAIHDAGFIHRDLKLVNVLVTADGQVKLADLGSSKSERNYARTKEGTWIYTAPEVLKQKDYDRSADIYSLGLILLEMWYGTTIYSQNDNGYEAQLEKSLPLRVGQQLPLPSWNGRAPPIPEWHKLINECLLGNREQRSTAENCRDRIAGMALPVAQSDSRSRSRRSDR